MSSIPREWLAVGLPVALVIMVAAMVANVALLLEQDVPENAESGVLTNSAGMELVPIPGGSFVMGSRRESAGRTEEMPAHPVRVEPFYLGRTEVTQAQWQSVMGTNPSRFKHPRKPVTQVTWFEAREFIKRLNRREETTKYRLPTEAEWEFAARAGSDTAYSFGDDPAALENYAWYGHRADVGARPVAQRRPNPWGLYDMHGNAWEWVRDCWHPDYEDAPAVARQWQGGDCSVRVVRGGGWDSAAPFLRSAVRGSYSPDMADLSTGFRLARDL